jgi:hypothetical protein
MSTLWVVGDSFASPETLGETHAWPGLLAAKLGADKVENHGVLGSSQMYAWAVLQAFTLQGKIKPDDYIVAVMTHPARKWYVHDDPAIGKVDHLKVYAREGTIPKELATAGELWDRYVDRPLLDVTDVENRLGWLAYNTHFRKWRKPIVLKTHEYEFNIAKDYPDIHVGEGNLTEDVSFKEIPGVEDGEQYNRVIKMYDPRHNHLCFSNHEILAEKLKDYFVNDTAVNLTTGFIQNLLTEQTINDPEFIKKELSEKRSQERVDILRKNAKNILFGWRNP